MPGPTMMHDFAITDRHAVFLDLPMTFSPRRLATGMPYGWDDAYGARLGVMPLDRPGEVTLVRRRPGLRLPRRQRPHRRRAAGSSSTPPATRPPTPSRCGTAWATTPPGTPPPRPPPAASRGCTAGCSTRRPAPSPRRRWRTGPSSSRPSTTSASAATRATGTPSPHGVAPASSSSTSRRARVTEHAVGAETVGGEAVFVPSCRGRPRRGRRLAAHDHHPARRQRVAAARAGRNRRRRAPVAAVTLPRGVPVGLPRVLDRGRPSCRERACELTIGHSERRERGRRASARRAPRASRRRPVSPRLMLRGLGWDVGLPVVAYYALHLAGVHDFVALLVASALAAARIVWVAVRERRAEPVRDRHARGVRDRPAPRVRQR